MQPTENDFKLARVLLEHSLKVKAKEKVLISVSDNGAMGLTKAVYIETLKCGAYPMVDMELAIQQGRSQVGGFNYQFYKLANEWQLNYMPEEIIKAKIAWADAYVRIVTDDNVKELANIEPSKLSKRAILARPLIDPMIDSNRWVLTYYPTPGMAQQAGMALDELSEFYYQACLVDYQKMKRELMGLQRIMDAGKE
ncbi:MAG: aminopeptidase, partial [bacterium]